MGDSIGPMAFLFPKAIGGSLWLFYFYGLQLISPPLAGGNKGEGDSLIRKKGV
jgi:hypothetical protein